MRNLWFVPVVLVAVLAGCGDGPTAVAKGKINIEITTSGGAPVVGFRLRSDPTCPAPERNIPLSANGPVIWSINNHAVATIDQNGLLEAVPGARGSVTATATPVGGGRPATVSGFVDDTPCATTPPPTTPVLTTIDYAPPGGTLNVGQTQQLVATCRDQFGNAMQCPSGLVWVSTHPGIISVSQSGLITCLGPTEKGNSATVSVQVPGGGPSNRYAWNCVSTATLVISPLSPTISLGVVGGACVAQMQFHVTFGGQAVTPTWQTTGGTIVGGLFRGTVVGEYTVTATHEGQTVSTTVTVTGSCPTSTPFQFSQSTLNLFMAGCTTSGQSTTTLYLTGPAVSVSSSNPGAVQVSSSSTAVTFTAVGVGVSTVTATDAQGRTAQIQVMVQACPSVPTPSVTVSGPTSFTCVAGETRTVTLNVTAQGGASTAGTWVKVSEAPTGAAPVVATHTQQGNTLNVTCLAPGQVVFRWTSATFASVTHTTTGTIGVGTVTCTVNNQTGSNFTITVAVGTTTTIPVVCTNQFGATLMPYGLSSNPSRVSIKGSQEVTITDPNTGQAITVTAGYSFQVRRIAAGNATLTIQVSIKDTAPITTIAVN